MKKYVILKLSDLSIKKFDCRDEYKSAFSIMQSRKVALKAFMYHEGAGQYIEQEVIEV